VADIPQQLQRGLADRYQLERELGRGGMATVYLAQDLRHDRPVALKVLHSELAAALGPERFLREIKLAARLQHPHILTVYDSGETAGRLWFTMPYVRGASLRDRLTREKQLVLEDALRIATEAARALDYAHRQGVIHRDIKPENLLVTAEGDTLVADFGIGRALGAPAAGERLTETGVVVGTPAYMSPEQSAGDRELDGRSDIYSLGVVLYEMLAGEPPFTGPTTQAIMARRLTETPRPLRLVRETVPDALERAVMKALAKAPADRFQNAAEFARVLTAPAVTTPAASTSSPATAPQVVSRRPRVPFGLAALGVGLLLGLGMLFAWLRARPGVETGGPKHVAVLPFENLGASEDDYFADGVTDAIRGKLTGIPGLQVTARSSSTQYKSTNTSPRQVGRELGVEYLLTGTVRWSKGRAGQSRVQVSPELIRVSTAAAQWQQPFEAPLTDVFQVQAEVATRVAQALGIALGVGEREQLGERPTTNLAAYDAYLRGEQVSDRLATNERARLRKAIEYYDQATAIDSSFALAWAQLSRAHSLSYFTVAPTPESAAAAQAAAERAVALAPGRAEGHLALGQYYRLVRQDYHSALEEFARGQRLAPTNADLLTETALTEQRLGRWEVSLEHLRRADSLDPRSVETSRRLTVTLHWLRRYPEALESSEQALALAPASIDLLEIKAMILLSQGDLSGARQVLHAAPKEVEPTALVAYLATFWDLYWVLDSKQQKLLLRMTPRAFDDDRGGWGLALAGTHALRGDTIKARAYADSARIGFEEGLKAAPEDAQLHTLLGVALGYLGRRAEAVREGERGVALKPVPRGGYGWAYLRHQLVRTYLLAGEPGKALDLLERLLEVPYYLSPGWLKIDPTFALLRGHPRFERLVNAT
jgi:TolB-like protein/Flp pilus assembly protein TadD/predicted Ser/Thr protein kinase